MDSLKNEFVTRRAPHVVFGPVESDRFVDGTPSMAQHCSRLKDGLAVMVSSRGLRLLAGLFVLTVTLRIVLGYDRYFPPQFDAGFLLGRESYFHSYRWAFFPHIVVGPVTLVLGTLLVSQRIRQRFPHWHRRLGRVQLVCILFGVTPSGLWMAGYADTGNFAAAGFATLALVTGAMAVLGWRAAVGRRYTEHSRWMWRCYMLLCSAVVLRLMASLTHWTETEVPWGYPAAAWLSWLLPLGGYEVARKVTDREPPRRSGDR